MFCHIRPSATSLHEVWRINGPGAPPAVQELKRTQRSPEASDWFYEHVITKNNESLFWHINGNQLHVNQKKKNKHFGPVHEAFFLHYIFDFKFSLTFSGISF